MVVQVVKTKSITTTRPPSTSLRNRTLRPSRSTSTTSGTRAAGGGSPASPPRAVPARIAKVAAHATVRPARLLVRMEVLLRGNVHPRLLPGIAGWLDRHGSERKTAEL